MFPGYTAVDKAETEEAFADSISVFEVRNLVKIANELNAKLIHFSTDYVFDAAKIDPYDENDKINPLSVYVRSKY